ncbi:histidine kinase [Streptomyces sp. MUM 203J]|uniref:histidine kinase n=1 Tax=Streptomyces sp. MUM 203J TaxID=2791990 RepID=UPI0035AB9A20
MAGLTGWWSRRSHPEKVELYTRWTFHGLCGTEVLLSVPSALAIALGARAGAGAVGGWLLLLALAHPVLVGVLCAQALSWQLGRRSRPGRLAVAVAVTSAAGCVGVAAVQLWGAPADAQFTGPLMVGFSAWGVGGLALCVLQARRMLALGLAAPAGVGLLCLALRVPVPETVASTVGAGFGSLVFAATSGFSGWLLRAVWELDAAHRLQARLAVAEERLRFARDLHDVMGRNLSVIALKSELAVQLVRRGSAERAEEQMAEVQRIAQDSQREVREVVRGYREADLHTELEGARGVLAAAGIRCRITTGPADLDLTAPVRAALGWVVREATTNTLRHGDARMCTLTLTAPEGAAQVILTVENDGAAPPEGTDTTGPSAACSAAAAPAGPRSTDTPGTAPVASDTPLRNTAPGAVPVSGAAAGVPHPRIADGSEAAPGTDCADTAGTGSAIVGTAAAGTSATGTAATAPDPTPGTAVAGGDAPPTAASRPAGTDAPGTTGADAASPTSALAAATGAASAVLPGGTATPAPTDGTAAVSPVAAPDTGTLRARAFGTAGTGGPTVRDGAGTPGTTAAAGPPSAPRPSTLGTAEAAPGSGLAGLRERLAVVGGTLEAGPLPGGRFLVTARVPLARRAEPRREPPPARAAAAPGEVAR